MKLVHQIDHVSMREYIHGIKTDNYLFYEENPYSKEVLIMGAANAGKSTLVNALNGQYEGIGAEKRLAYTSKASGKTFQMNFYRTQNRHDPK